MNYLPFVRRAIISLPVAPARRSFTVPAMSIGPGRAILQDFEVSVGSWVNVYGPNETDDYTYQMGRAQILMRYGWERKGFLTEDFHPVDIFHNIGRPLVPVWKFERPYRLDPGEELQAVITAGGAYNIASMPAESTPAIVFNAVRVKDNQPKLLYDVSPTIDTTGTVVALSTTCDADSSLMIYSVAIHDWFEYNAISTAAAFPTVSKLQIFGPGGREWFHIESDSTLTAATLLAFSGAWIEGSNDRIDLGEQRGWIQEPDEAFIAEFKQPTIEMNDNGPTAATRTLVATLRGVLEMPND